MKSFIVLALFVAAAVAAPAALGGPDADAQILRNENDVGAEGFSSIYVTSNGIASQAEGQLKVIGDSSALVMSGQYSYTGPDGVVYSVTYRADENGFQADGAHLPKAS